MLNFSSNFNELRDHTNATNWHLAPVEKGWFEKSSAVFRAWDQGAATQSTAAP
jgi:hypothetical protein